MFLQRERIAFQEFARHKYVSQGRTLCNVVDKIYDHGLWNPLSIGMNLNKINEIYKLWEVTSEKGSYSQDSTFIFLTSTQFQAFILDLEYFT